MMFSATERLETEIAVLTDKYNRTNGECQRWMLRGLKLHVALLDKRLELATMKGDRAETATVREEMRFLQRFKAAVDEIQEQARREFPGYAPPILH
jgi:hypothetical protein